MSLLARHRYIIGKLAEAFGYPDDSEIEDMLLATEVLDAINFFFSADGPTKILISEDVGDPKLDTPKRLKVSTRELQCVSETAVFFIKAKKGKDRYFAIDASKANDGTLTFGVLRAPLDSLEVVLRNIYRPLLQDGAESWGEATSEQRNEFLLSLDAFTKGLQDSIRSLSGGLELSKPDPRVEAMGLSAANDAMLVAGTMNLLHEWCFSIERYLDDNNRKSWESPDSGPDTELEYWRNRMQRLTSITEQLKSKPVKAVITLLTSVVRQAEHMNPNDCVVDTQRAGTLLAQWREIDVHITEAANEAKDNVKFLSTLERFFEPLYGADPSDILDALPSMINALKMIHTISRYFGTTERMTKLMMKITNQMITTCKLSINGKDHQDRIWDKSLTTLLEAIEKCLQLNEEYQEQYRLTKEKLMTTVKGKQFDFSETQIFGKFDLFCRRLIKLMDMFSSMQQFRSLAQQRFEGLEPLLQAFNEVVNQFRTKGHDLLDFHNNRFDRDYVDFNVKMNELENSLQHFINRSFENIGSIEQSLALLKKYQTILHRENLRSDLDSKLTVIFHNYGQELTRVEQIYEKHKHNPPVARNVPPVAGNIAWARHLLRKIEDPMRKFQGNSNVLASKESKKIIRSYNKVARTLIAFEYLWYEAWTASIEQAKAGLQATLIIRHPSTNKLYVNFDQELFQLLREAKCLAKLEVVVPEGAKIVLLQEDKFKAYYNDLKFLLSEYERITNRMISVTKKTLRPHLQSLELKLRPGLVTLTWTSMNIDAYKAHILQGLSKLEDLIAKVNDIVESRIQKNLKLISRSVIVNIPTERAVALDEFVQMQEATVKANTAYMASKNLEVETAVADLIAVLQSVAIEPGVEPVNPADVAELEGHFRNLTYQAVLYCVKNSLNFIKKRTASRPGIILFPFFEVDVQLSVPSVRLSPSLDDIQRAINRAAVAILSVAKRMWQWGQNNMLEKDRRSMFDRMGQDIEIIKTVLLLTGAMQGTRNVVGEYLKEFGRYDWIWKDDKEAAYKMFMHRNPSISDFEDQLKRFLLLEEEISNIKDFHTIGALKLSMVNLKQQLINESRQWKVVFSNKIHIHAREATYNVFEYMRLTTNKLNIDVQSLDTLRYVMTVLKEIREKESSIEMEICPILDTYSMLDHYLPGLVSDKDELEHKSTVRAAWRKVIDMAEVVTNNLGAVQGTYKKQLVIDIRDFSADVKTYRREFDDNGPVQAGIKPTVAVEKLKKFKEQLLVLERKLEMYRAGEELFALRPTRFTEITKTRKEVALLDQLYGLYVDVLQCTHQWASVVWTYVSEMLPSMIDMVNSFDARCKKLPKKLREWKAYDELRSKISDFQMLLPLLEQLSKPSIKSRHWEEVNSLLKTPLPYSDGESFTLVLLMDSNILEVKDDVEEICDSADKQLAIERKMVELKDMWSVCQFEFTMWKNRDVPVLKAFGYVIEELEEAQLSIQTLLSARHVAPFREELQKFLSVLSDTADTLEMWVKVQMIWTSLESVFLGGDIAKQMPLEAKKFGKINKDWEKLMVRAAETKLVVQSCGNELLRSTLPALYSELEKCQKSLEGYLEQKRGKFPRFYFVSNPVLLVILSQGSDPQQMQPYYEKVFDSIDRVVHNKLDKSFINEIQSSVGTAKESITMFKPVKAHGNIEDWLGEVELEMQRSLKRLCEQTAVESATIALRQMVTKACGQFALLGVQFMWTAQCTEALSKAKTNKGIMVETNRMNLAILQDLSQWCLEDLGSAMNRIKVETLVTIQVHQRDVFSDLNKLFKERKLSDTHDFEWLKQLRFYWQAQSNDEHGPGACVIAICDVEYKYSFEYLGCKDRLVITPLTDRCFITLSQAMGMCLGGAPAGPAGTGKTETVKDLGRSIGVFVVVTNCTDQQRYTDMAKIFKGLCQAGLWGCFDEFNRIELPVLSVVAQQILTITNAKKAHSATFTFPGDSQEIRLNRHVGYFITMNPGYQGRQELPENLKTLFRGVAMMVPDFEIIIKVRLCSVGFEQFPDLARKFAVLYDLCGQQLSKQKHYDFGLRNILSVLRGAGQMKRNRRNEREEALLMSTLRDMNLSKLVAQDVPLFLTLLSDLFPSVGMPGGSQHSELKVALGNVLDAESLIAHPTWLTKVIQLYETTLVRHGIMMVGPAGTGKTRIINSLQDTLTQTTGTVHKRLKMNPKAIRAEEMFGETDKTSGEWLDGIFSTIWSKFNDRNRKDIQWIICDGPVDALWIENLNSVLDDNKILTLANGDRIPMTDNVKLMFEVEDLRNASPATVSRAGIIYVSESDLDWGPVLLSWLKRKPANIAQVFANCFTKYVGKCTGPKSFGHLFHFVYKHCKLVVNTCRVGIIEGCCHLLDGLLATADLATANASLAEELERLFIYAISWSVGGLLEIEDRARFTEYFMGKFGPTPASEDGASSPAPASNEPNQLPPMAEGDTIFEYMVNPDSMEWEKWAAPVWEYPSHIEEPDFSNMLVPTIETTRSTFILSKLHSHRHAALMTGSSGTAKTSTAQMFFDHMAMDNMKIKKVCFSSATTPAMFQLSVESELDKRGGKNFGPPGGKKMTVFMDDLSMPEKNNWGDQPTLELARQLLETNGCCFLDKDKRGDMKILEDLQYIAAMGHPGGGRQDIPNRLKRHFFIFNLILPSTQAINEIYGQMLAGRFVKVPSFFSHIVKHLPNATIELWTWMRTKMLPSPSKFHYLFTLRDLSRVFQGVLRTPRMSVTNTHTFMLLWRHECERVFSDKLTNVDDKSAFMETLNVVTQELLTTPTAEAIARNKVRVAQQRGGAGGMAKGPQADIPAADGDHIVKFHEIKDKEPFFVDFLRDDIYDDDGVLTQEAPKIYELGGTMEDLRERVQDFLMKYNENYPSKAMNLVLFDDAMRHLMRISRCLGMPKGCMLLVGVGGSGKQSLTKLASYCSGYGTFQITLTKQYNMGSLLDDLRVIYKQCGQQGLKTTFLFTEAEIKDESFLEVINSILTTGEVANLLPKDELLLMASDLRGIASKQIANFVDTPDNLCKFFIDRVRSNLHLVLCMSPVSTKFPERARKFPGIIGGCTIDWFLAWPKEALVAVSKGFISQMTMDCTHSVREELIVHMGMVHKLVTDACDEYFQKMRRHVYQTPKSFLSFLGDYSAMYAKKCADITIKASRVDIGLEKLKSGAKDVERMKIVLAEEEVKLKLAEESTNVMLSKLEVSARDAKKEADAVAKIKEACQIDADRIAGEKADAEEDLAKAQPFVDEAERAVGSIKPNDLNELKKLGKPSDVIKLIFDCVALLKMEKLNRTEPMEVTLGVGKEKKTFMFIKDSYKFAQTGMLSDTRFLQGIFHFSKSEKDFINDETIEFMTPYLDLDGFNAMTARNASRAAEGLCVWCRAMSDYHEASKIVKPKLEALRLAEARLQDAERELYKAEMRLKAVQDVLTGLQNDFDKQILQKRAIEQNALNTKKRMEQATALINGLAGERMRWQSDREEFANTKMQLVGDVALACAFVAYCGPFNQDFREYLIHHRLSTDLKERKIPLSANVDLTDFLADAGTIGDWNMEGLPSDPLSVQNGILVTRSSRYPLLIDPQGQAINWISNHEEAKIPAFGTTTSTHPKFREQMEYCLAEGKAIIITGIENEIDPMMSPVLEKQIITKAKSKYITVAGKTCDYVDDFMLYLVTRLPNPHFTPEDQSKCTIVDFTVTQKGLEEQLLGRVIQKEQRSLEESLKGVLEDVTNNTKALLRLDQMLLERLTENTGNLLDDDELIVVLADTKTKATDVKEKLNAAAEMRRNINEKREQFRPVATRGSVLYFSIVDMSHVNCMYQTSLDQFQILFDKSMDIAEKASLASKRVNNIIDSLTLITYRYINRGLYEMDKVSFKLILLFKILIAAGKLEPRFVGLFLRGGSALDINNVRQKALAWVSNEAWLNIIQLSNSSLQFKNFPDDIELNESQFLPWFNENEPEKFPVPVIETRFSTVDEVLQHFYRLLLVRCLREDRTLLAVNDFIRKTESIEVGGSKVPCMGSRYVEPVTDTVETIYREMVEPSVPVIFLLSAGADPTDSIETLARRKRKPIECVSMGEGQDVVALRAIGTATSNGSWVLLQNCHLGLGFIDSLEDILLKLQAVDSGCSPEFRLFITTEPHPKFSIGLLQMSTKVTNEPPKGLRAGLQRSYTAIIDQDRLERIESTMWRALLFTMCFTHSVVQERRKFGPLGWCIPYEFNDGDLNASITFLEKHLEFSSLSWPTLQYMVGQVQYGGRVTDDMDRRLLMGYTEAWLGPSTLSTNFTFNPETCINKLAMGGFIYKIPTFLEMEDYLAYISKMPEVDSPEVLGLHPNADLTFRFKEVTQLLNTILETQPKQSGAVAGGKSREDIVFEKCEELSESIPADYIEDEYEERLAALGGYDIPLNIFLYQEVQRLQAAIFKVRSTLVVVMQAIRGEVVVTADILDSINAIFDARVPRIWLYSPAGDELSWLAPNLGVWFGGLIQRDLQYRTWLNTGRPVSFWMAGFFNPQGFLTAVQQEITRSHKGDNWALDSVVLHSEVSDIQNVDHCRNSPKEGVYVHGLFMDGAAWNPSENSIMESQPKKLFAALPVLLVTAMSKKGKGSGNPTSNVDYGVHGGYECPVYKYPIRTDKYLIFSVMLPSQNHRPGHWTLRGVALLCTTSA